MEYAKKMILVPMSEDTDKTVNNDTGSRYSREPMMIGCGDTETPAVNEKTVQTPGDAASRLDTELFRIFKSNKHGKDDAGKCKEYLQVLQRYLFLVGPKNESFAPAPPPPLPEGPSMLDGEQTTNDDDIVNSVPNIYKRRATALLKYLRRHSSDASNNIRWDNKGCVTIDRMLVPNSNIVDLINDAVRSRKGFKAVGRDEFIGSLRTRGVPREFIGNDMLWNLGKPRGTKRRRRQQPLRQRTRKHSSGNNFHDSDENDNALDDDDDDDNVQKLLDGYLVWNPKCHMLSKDPMDPSIRKFVKKEKFEACSSTPLMSYVSRDPTNGSTYIAINVTVAKAHKSPVCCWASIVRPSPSRPPKGKFDTNISVGKCIDFEKRVYVPQDVELAMVTCRKGKKGKTMVYENVHAIINTATVHDRMDNTSEPQRATRKLSVLLLGIDSVSRLNFKRSMPRTEKYLRETDWFHLEGYNKMGENTFSNLMAILTGQNSTTSYSDCKPTVAFGLDHCPFIWYNFRNASYVTAYGEDLISLSTFNFKKVGFVDPPTDYYLRPYVLATENLLKSKIKFGRKYCTGPEISVERIFNYAVDFSRTFIQVPYFGLFWTNSVSHDDLNGLSSMDDRILDMFDGMKRDGIFNDTMIIFLSDHGRRWGEIRKTSIGWYAERLPFIYIRLPEWFRDEEPRAYDSMRLNQHRLTSPYDLYETLRDVLVRAGGEAHPSSGCSTCQSLFRPVPVERGCDDVGVTPHWCTCTAFSSGNTSDKIATQGTKKFLEHVENIIKDYKDKNGKRMCSELKLKKIHRVDKVMDIEHGVNSSINAVKGYFYLIEVTSGGAKYETTIRYHGGDHFTIADDEISRIDSYASSSRCLDHGSKRFCHCVGN